MRQGNALRLGLTLAVAAFCLPGGVGGQGNDLGVSLDPGAPPSGNPGPIAGLVSENQGVTCTAIDFEGLGDNVEIGTVSGEPNVTFGSGWFSLIDFDAGGNGNFANEPSPETVAFVPVGSIPAIDFDTGVQFAEVFYVASAASLPITLTAYDGPNGTGNVVDSVVGNTVGTDFDGAPCTGDPNGNFCLWDQVTLLAADNNILSVVITGGVANQFAFDDMEYCTGDPADAPALPLWGWVALVALLAAAAAWRLRSRVA